MNEEDEDDGGVLNVWKIEKNVKFDKQPEIQLKF